MVPIPIIKNIVTPTGNILILQGEHGKLESLSLGDYGKEANIKADFMGLERPIHGVEHREVMPLQKKWVVTISSQYGCRMGCAFCDVPRVKFGGNATVDDLCGQVMAAISIHPEVKYTERLNLHYARMGEPTCNDNVIESTLLLYNHFSEHGFLFHPVVSTMCPHYIHYTMFIYRWLSIKNVNLKGNAGLQLSINTTDDDRRLSTMPKADRLDNISRNMRSVISALGGVRGRKIALNIALQSGAEVSGRRMRELFDPEHFMVKITPIHATSACRRNKIATEHGYRQYEPYMSVEEDLKSHGFDVLVFIPSREEDESRITCGNAILSDSAMHDEYPEAR